MIDNNVLDQALKKKDKEIEKVNQKLEEVKKNYELKIKNLMSSINQLKNEKTDIETKSKDNVRVNIINGLKKEIKDKEQIINLLRKMIGDEEKVDKYLLKEFGKQGEDRVVSYEEMKIKIKQLEADIVNLKHKLTDKNNKTNKTDEVVDNTAIFIRQIETQKDEIEKINSELLVQKNENIILKLAKEKLEKLQSELFEKIKSTNKELGEMKSVYDVIKKNFEDESELKSKELKDKILFLERENTKIKAKLVELIEISEKQNKENSEKFKKINVENEVLKRIVESKNNELKVLEEELKSYEGELGREDDKAMSKYKRLEREVYDLRKILSESKEKNVMYERLVKDKELEIENVKSMIKDKDEIICEKNQEIELIESKMEELENYLIENRKK